MTVTFKVQQFHKMLNGLFDSGISAAVLLPDGTPLHLQYTHLADIGTLPQAGRITNQYLQLKPGQVAIMNDPYSGGTLLSTLTLITGVNVQEKASDKSDFLLVYRFPLRPHLKLAASVDEEGLRVPPTPIAEAKSINDELIHAMASHPLAPESFLERVHEGIKRIRKISSDFQKSFRIFNLSCTKTLIQGFLNHSLNVMKEQLSDLPLGDTSLQMALPENARIRLHLELTGEKVLVDFTGSTNSRTLHLTDSATFGACFGALITMLGQDLPINGGSFQLLEVRTPTGTLLNAKYPAPTFLGMTDGVNLTASLVLKALGQLVPPRQVSMSQPGQCTLDIEFEGGKHFFDTVAAGVGASRDARGETGLPFWSRSSLQASIEDIENRFPLRVISFTARTGSGGKGLQKGGDGLVKMYELTAPATVRWSLGAAIKLEGVDGGASGGENEILFQRKSGQKEKGESFGQTRLEAGDVITIHSAGGSGFGHSKS